MKQIGNFDKFAKSELSKWSIFCLASLSKILWSLNHLKWQKTRSDKTRFEYFAECGKCAKIGASKWSGFWIAASGKNYSNSWVKPRPKKLLNKLCMYIVHICTLQFTRTPEKPFDVVLMK